MTASSIKGVIDKVLSMPDKKKNENPKMDFKEFLEFMEMCSAGSFSAPSASKITYNNFKELLHDLDRCSVSGSSILNYRLNIEKESEDVDIFLEDTKENKEILSAFFNDPHFKEVFKGYHKRYLSDIKECNREKGLYEKMGFNEDYCHLKLDYMMDTFRFSFSHIRKFGFNLNFIFVKRLLHDERRLVGIQERMTASLYEEKLTDRHGKLRFQSISSFSNGLNEDEKLALTKDLPRGIPLHIINDSFDFEELKYVYSFELQQPVSVYIAAKMQLQKYIKRVESLVDNKEVNSKLSIDIIKDLNHIIANLERENENFLKATSDPKVISISDKFIPKSTRILLTNHTFDITSGEALEFIFGDMDSKHITQGVKNANIAYHNIMGRVPKYEKKGFIVDDPRNVISQLQLFIATHVSYIMQKEGLNKIAMRSGLMTGIRHSTQRTKILRDVYKRFEELTVANSIPIRQKEITVEPI